MSDDDPRRWDLPPEGQWVEVEFLGVAKFFCLHKMSGFPVWCRTDGRFHIIDNVWWKPLPGEK